MEINNLEECSRKTENGATVTANIILTVNTKPIYTVTINNGASGSYEEGATLIITAEYPPAGKKIAGWKVDSENVTFTDSSSATMTFVMPAEAVTNYTMKRL